MDSTEFVRYSVSIIIRKKDITNVLRCLIVFQSGESPKSWIIIKVSICKKRTDSPCINNSRTTHLVPSLMSFMSLGIISYRYTM